MEHELSPHVFSHKVVMRRECSTSAPSPCVDLIAWRIQQEVYWHAPTFGRGPTEREPDWGTGGDA